ncbi:BON domain-containing protein [Martelella endophytica]|uniref:BON domain-containing protein n=1 Tax=Martelella endophytica TaxID=1486262 RepID=A0A0D5LNK7_MAREN|nr:BON domain-containing protein [Martelella endophytica]AJY45726.1 hypothetical protein TM49_08585 [Martelella endophytica]
MAEVNRKLHESAREEDYRDFEARDLDDGWPYGDEDGRKGRRNAPYGATSSNLDQRADAGAEITGDTVLKRGVGKSLTDAEEERLIENDDLADTITRCIDDDDRFDVGLITVDVSRGIARLEGEVETEEDRVHLERMVLAVKGVRDVRSHVMLIGADSHVPWDFDQ